MLEVLQLRVSVSLRTDLLPTERIARADHASVLHEAEPDAIARMSCRVPLEALVLFVQDAMDLLEVAGDDGVAILVNLDLCTQEVKLIFNDLVAGRIFWPVEAGGEDVGHEAEAVSIHI